MATRIIDENDNLIAQETAYQEIENAIISIEKFLKTSIRPYIIKIKLLNGQPNETMEAVPATLNVRKSVSQADVNQLSLDVDLMKKDENYKKALLLWTKPPVRTWNELSKIIELVKHRAKIDPIKEGWISESDLNAFSASANNESISGVLNARHAKEYGDPPKNTMTLQHGDKIVESLLNKWKQKLAGNT